MISCVILNYNGEKLLKPCLDSIFALNFQEKEIIFIDNASTDNSVEFVLKHYVVGADGKPLVRVIANKENSGYAGGANQAVKVSDGDFVMVLNPDIVFEPDYLDILMERLKKDKKIGAIIGKLRKYDFERGRKTNLIDSAGLLMFKNRRCVDRGQGEEDCGQYDGKEEVFGVTGACPLYRRLALKDSKIGNEYFDSDFFMYKEDVDISWRMRLLGWKCFYEPKAVAYHGRGTGILSRAGVLEVAAGRSKLSKSQKYYSYKNERLMRVKNELRPNVLRDFLPILWKEILMTGWILLREQFLIKSFFKFLWQLPGALRKRREIMARVKISANEMNKWFI
ncbi:glycosyltransferase family 2 protein [Candidatus Peregrinibacteria bacterium]|nr:glycosyltransferase family 2 protein [Candidatus Peregrinibacteria bacterium]